MKKKIVKTAPLPFQGQKRNFVNQYAEALKAFPSDAIYVDLFGGSGLLSRVTKNVYPEARVIYNDYDNFSKRLKAIPETNVLLAELRQLVTHIESKTKISNQVKTAILKVVKTHENDFGYVDYVTLSSSLLFSGKYVGSFEELEKQTMYQRVRKSDITEANEYLNGLEVVHQDFKALYSFYKDYPNVIFVLDPPYLSTDTSSYGNKYWRLRDYLEILSMLDGKKYFYFTSDKSSIVELMDWFETTTLTENPFKYATTATRQNGVNYNSKYNDIMIYKNE
ncbi:hypothetical protein GGR32_000119 [Mesonia hippocampi]|uniref:site-specific DNA-methyltransferase (adenine-specific) n=1 Tax=Mesonia hippocampi TaxID=1628250 RepID=A0A840ESD0_9FLAO|nr:DNA adenine methylase [Mesonia hippocampi]MBB4117847.1 hypothetical protein [Mesonia hippocampi]